MQTTRIENPIAGRNEDMGCYFAYPLQHHVSRVRTYNRCMASYILNLSCPDRTGIVHAVSGFLVERQGNIEEAAQYNDPDTGLFFMRVRFACGAVAQEALRNQLVDLAQSLSMQWTLHDASQPMRTVLMVSKEGHCLNDLLFRWKSGLLEIGRAHV